ncbi:hypothetical protein DCAR_0104071 [Daucus carota subsp. sativus]|uniref:Uncharacterized protein n=1 Tax=Daucus carota subsp. sativus TaxID=79200 RepID=A0A166IIW1_DAUCS|nr:hypothetical protein DCAR_0104071 [Daucus carota subsp. sativus]
MSNAVAFAHLHSGLAEVNILLPPKMTHPVAYTLQGHGACFNWSCDNPDILSIVPTFDSSNECSTSSQLKSIAPFSGRKETVVYATDADTGRVHRCKVYIDDIARIELFHTSAKLDIDEFATLRVGAFDRQENMFSSLVGVQFKWQLIPETEGSIHHLVHVPLEFSPLTNCGGLCGDIDVRIKLEEAGVFSDLYVVKGTEIGHERVAVELDEPMYNYQMADSFVFHVAESVSLNPSSQVFILVGADVQYFPEIERGSISVPVNLPSPHYQWAVSNATVCWVDTALGRVHALNLGVTTIGLADTRVGGIIQSATLHVVLPDSLYIFILPLSLSGDIPEGATPVPSVSPWYVVVGRPYLLVMKVFSRGHEAEEMYITESDNISLHDNHSEFWNLYPLSENSSSTNWWLNSKILKTKAPGFGELTATLSYTSGVHEAKEVLKVVQQVMVCEQVKFVTENRSRITISQEVELKVTGGCAVSSSNYKWFSTDMSIVSVSPNGIVQPKQPGKAVITVVSIYDTFNNDEVEIEVASSLNLRPSPLVVDGHSHSHSHPHPAEGTCKNNETSTIKHETILTSKVPNTWHELAKKNHLSHGYKRHGSTLAALQEHRYNISVSAPSGILTNAPFLTEGYSFPVTFGDSIDHGHAPIQYDCKVEPAFLGYTNPWRADNHKSCLFFPYSPDHLERSVGHLDGISQNISVTITACVHGALSCGSAFSLFVGGFAILGMNHNLLHLDLTRDHDKSIITLVGNTDVTIQWKSQSVLHITPIFTRKDVVAGRVEYEIKALSSESLKDKVIFSLGANGQTAEIDVNFELQKPMQLPTQLTAYEKLYMIFVVCVLVSVVRLFYVEKQPRATTTIVQRSEYLPPQATV